MKQKDIILISVVIIISAFASILISNSLISSPKHRSAKVEVVDSITSDFAKPDPKYFNKDSINPTKLIQIGENPNPSPFQ